MDFNVLIAAVQLALAALQLRYDHFKKPSNRTDENGMDEFYNLGEAIRTLEFALAETVAYVGQTTNRQPNQRLASLWENASNAVRQIRDGADLADLTFEKNLYWRNPEFYRGQSESKLHRISLENVLTQLRRLRTDYDKLQRQITD